MKKILFGSNKNIIARQIKLARVSAGLTQEQLAAKLQTLGLNIDQQMISKIEHNARIVTDYELGCFCYLLKMDPSELFTKFIENYIE